MKLVVTAGPTREHLDPVRFLSNPSTGKMGFAIAAEAARRGLEVVLVAGPVALRTPKGVERVDVVSAREMMRETARAAKGADALVATAAVADWRPAHCSRTKLKKREMAGVLRLVRNPDVLKSVRVPLKVGFAAETGGDVVAEARRKCREKSLAFVVANDVTEKGAGFGTDTNRVAFVFPDGEVRRLPLMSKRRVARRVVDEIISQMKA
ncbi:MAG: hypothetical protein IJH50_07120 [Kiritimatiellae bacterium]|nr:hypothetical protein [Kiritimatiellia bacterium]